MAGAAEARKATQMRYDRYRQWGMRRSWWLGEERTERKKEARPICPRCSRNIETQAIWSNGRYVCAVCAHQEYLDEQD